MNNKLKVIIYEMISLNCADSGVYWIENHMNKNKLTVTTDTRIINKLKER